MDSAGYSRLTAGSGSNHVLIWTFEHELGTQDREIYVLNEDRIVAKVGQMVQVSGGEVGTSLVGVAAIDEQTRQELQARCPGGYWVVGNEVSTIKR